MIECHHKICQNVFKCKITWIWPWILSYNIFAWEEIMLCGCWLSTSRHIYKQDTNNNPLFLLCISFIKLTSLHHNYHTGQTTIAVVYIIQPWLSDNKTQSSNYNNIVWIAYFNKHGLFIQRETTKQSSDIDKQTVKQTLLNGRY